MENTQIDILQNALDDLPLKQWEQIQFLAMKDRSKIPAVNRWRAHCELCHMYMNFPFLY